MVCFKEQNGKRMNHHEAGQVSNFFQFQKKLRSPKTFSLRKWLIQNALIIIDQGFSNMSKWPFTLISHVCFLKSYKLFHFIILQSKITLEEKEYNYSSSTARLFEFSHHTDNYINVILWIFSFDSWNILFYLFIFLFNGQTVHLFHTLLFCPLILV